MEIAREIKKSIFLSKKGKVKKKIIEGGINKRTEFDSSITDFTSLVSK